MNMHYKTIMDIIRSTLDIWVAYAQLNGYDSLCVLKHCVTRFNLCPSLMLAFSNETFLIFFITTIDLTNGKVKKNLGKAKDSFVSGDINRFDIDFDAREHITVSVITIVSNVQELILEISTRSRTIWNQRTLTKRSIKKLILIYPVWVNTIVLSVRKYFRTKSRGVSYWLFEW